MTRTFFKAVRSRVVHESRDCSHYRRMRHAEPPTLMKEIVSAKVPSHHTLCDECQSIARRVKGRK